MQDYHENSYDMPGAKVSTNTVEIHSLPQGPKYLHESSLELSQSKTKLPAYVSATSFQAHKSPSQTQPSRKRSAKASRAVSPELAAPQNNLSLMNAFLKKKPKLTKRSKSRDDSKERKRKKRQPKKSIDLSRERENYNRKLDETVSRILDREREYLEEQLLREKRENRAKDEMVTALKSDI